MTKPREFWITEMNWSTKLFTNKEDADELERTSGVATIHVIEKSVALSLASTNKLLSDEVIIYMNERDELKTQLSDAKRATLKMEHSAQDAHEQCEKLAAALDLINSIDGPNDTYAFTEHLKISDEAMTEYEEWKVKWTHTSMKKK